MINCNEQHEGVAASEDESDMMSLENNTPLLVDVDADQSKATRKMNLLNLVIISVIFLLQNASFSIYLDSSLSIWGSSDLDRWWFISKCIFIGFYLLSCSLAPFICKHILSIKQCLLLGATATSGIVFAQMIPSAYTLIPAAILLGLLLPLQFVALGIWHTDNSRVYSSPYGTQLPTVNPEASITMFHAIFHCMYFFGPVLRSALHLLLSDSSLYLDERSVLFYGNEEPTLRCNFKESFIPSLHYNNITNNNHRLFRIEALMGCYLTLSLAAVLFIVFCFTSPVFTPDTKSKVDLQKSDKKVLPGIDVNLLVMCLGFAIGVEQYFIYNVVPQVITTCQFFNEDRDLHLMFIIAVAGVSSCHALFQAFFTKYLGRCKLLVISSLIMIAVLVTLLSVKSEQITSSMIFIVGTAWATSDAIWQIQFSAMLSIRFEQYKACVFSCFRLWQMCGLSASYFLHYFQRSSYIIYVCLTIVALTVLLYFASEISNRLREQEQRRVHTSKFQLEEVASATWIPKLNPLKRGKRAQLINFPTSMK